MSGGDREVASRSVSEPAACDVAASNAIASDEAARDDRGWNRYGTAVLAVYDLWVHALSDRFLWRCPVERLDRLYDDHLRAEHLEIGVGTGRLLSRAIDRSPSLTISSSRQQRAITLVDANPRCLAAAAAALARRRGSSSVCEVRRERRDLRDVDEPTPARAFESAALVYLLHCIPGEAGKRQAIRFAADRLRPDGVCFGATLVGRPPAVGWAGRLERHYRRVGFFANADDDRASLQQWLDEAFDDVTIEACGRALLFVARSPRPSLPSRAANAR